MNLFKRSDTLEEETSVGALTGIGSGATVGALGMSAVTIGAACVATGAGYALGIDAEDVGGTGSGACSILATFSCVRPKAAIPRTAPIAIWKSPAP